jgi:hypothetical protein
VSEGEAMKKIALVAVLLVVLGALSFIAPIPRRENHEVQIGDTKIGIQTENTEKLPPQRSVSFLSLGAFSSWLSTTQNLKTTSSLQIDDGSTVVAVVVVVVVIPIPLGVPAVLIFTPPTMSILPATLPSFA